jgi:hypothetical protein
LFRTKYKFNSLGSSPVDEWSKDGGHFMAKFRSGSLLLTSNQTIIHGSTTILDTTRKGLFNTLALDSAGAVITEFSIDGTLVGNSDTALPTQKAVKTYVDNGLSGFAPNKISQLTSKVEVLDPGVPGGGIEFVTHGYGAMKVYGGFTSIGNVGIGLPFNMGPFATLDIAKTVLPSSLCLETYSTGSGMCSSVRFIRSNSDTMRNFTATLDTQNLGELRFNGICNTLDPGTPAAYIDVIQDGNAGATWVPGKICFGVTKSDGSSNYGLIIRNNATVESGSLTITRSDKAAGYFYMGATDPTNSTRLNYDGYFYATRVYNAIWNDISDFQDLADPAFYAGKCYYDTIDGAKLCSERCQKSVIGVASDTFGYGVGQDSSKTQVSIAVCGWVLAHITDVASYVPGDVLTNDSDGNLVKMTDQEKTLYPERIVAIYKRKENKEFFGPNDQVVVNGRHWVKVK